MEMEAVLLYIAPTMEVLAIGCFKRRTFTVKHKVVGGYYARKVHARCTNFDTFFGN